MSKEYKIEFAKTLICGTLGMAAMYLIMVGVMSLPY